MKIRYSTWPEPDRQIGFAYMQFVYRQRKTISSESPHHTHIKSDEKTYGKGQWSNSQGRIIECGAIASLLVGHWKQARRKWFVQLDRPAWPCELEQIPARSRIDG